MMENTQTFTVSKSIFGPYIIDSISNGVENKNNTDGNKTKRVQELFEMIDDYIEQA